jgi:cysteine-rich repeat protein
MKLSPIPSTLLSFGVALSLALLLAGTFSVSAQSPVIPLDIVFAVDESGSMSSAQEGVKTQVSSMFAQLAAAFPAFRMGLVGFGQDDNGGDPLLRHVLTRNQTSFQGAVDALETFGGYEPGFLAARQIANNSVAGEALNASSDYPGSFPGEAGYCVVLISDENSDGPDTLSDTTNDLIRTGGHFFAITNGQSDYTDLAAATNGTSHDLSDFIADSAPVLQSILDTCVTSVTLAYCGDGTVDAIEECDDGNTVSGDGCSATCKLEEEQNCTGRTYWLWDPKNDTEVGELLNNSASCISVPYNIEVRPCTAPETLPVVLKLKNATLATLKTQKEDVAPFYLWGDTPATGDVYRNTKPLPNGTYWLYSTVDGVLEKLAFTQTC